MKKDVSINIKAVQTAENECDTTELFTCGRFSKRRKSQDSNGGYTLSYDESEVIGYAGSKISLDVDGNNIVVMRRSGEAYANLVIEKGKKHHCHYGTPYGDFVVGITADDVKCNINDSGGDLYLKYTIDVNSTLMSENEMYINFKEKGTRK